MATVLEESLEQPGCIVFRQTKREKREKHREEDMGSEVDKAVTGKGWQCTGPLGSSVGPTLALHGRQSKATAGGTG